MITNVYNTVCSGHTSYLFKFDKACGPARFCMIFTATKLLENRLCYFNFWTANCKNYYNTHANVFFLFPGKVDYVGSSHQWWHFLVVLALYYWHNTGILYIEYRMNHGCAHDLRLWYNWTIIAQRVYYNYYYVMTKLFFVLSCFVIFQFTDCT